MDNVIQLLQERGLIEAITSEEVKEAAKRPLRVYCGFDPTADSLHLGNMVALMGLSWFQRFGHTPVALIGGATGMVGDPSGKSKERRLLDSTTIENNLRGIRRNLEIFLDFNHPTAKPIIVNNYDWLGKFTLIDFLRDVGKYFRIGPMLAKESVRQRLNSPEGMSFTEFSYQLLQGYDFLHLYRDHGVTVQLGGSDQWGNIVGGADLIRKVEGTTVYGVTFPLLTSSDGKKFGKTEQGTIWLAPEKLSPYEFYQYLFRVPDADVIKLLKILTFVDINEINTLEKSMQQEHYVPNTAQELLAKEVTTIVHGEKGLQAALKATAYARPGSEAVLKAESLEKIADDMPGVRMSLQQVVGAKIMDLFVEVGLQTSKGEVRRLIRNGGARLNNEKITDEDFTITKDDLIEGKLILLAVGKKKKVLIRVFEAD